MDNLVGGSLSLEQRYDVDAFVGTFGGISIYSGFQRPLDRPIWIHVFAHPGRREPHVARQWVERVRTAVGVANSISNDHVLDIVDFGEVEDGVPFIIYEQKEGATRLSERAGAMSNDEILWVVTEMAEVVTELADRGLAHGALAPEFVFTSDDRLWLANAGIGFTRAEVALFDGDDLSGLFSFPPPIVLDKASHEPASDPYGIAAIGYFLASGVHPHLDNDGGLATAQPEPLSTYGIDTRLSNAISGQFSEDSRDLEILRRSAIVTRTFEIDRPQPEYEDEEAVVVREDEPSNVITILGAVIVFLLVSNALTFLWAIRQGPEEDDAPKERIETTVIPQGYLLTTEPQGVDVTDIVSGKEIGQTPLSIDPRLGKDGVLKLKLEKRGFTPMEIGITKKDGVDDAVFVRMEKELRN